MCLTDASLPSREAWIEIRFLAMMIISLRRFPRGKRGLKFLSWYNLLENYEVASLAGSVD